MFRISDIVYLLLRRTLGVALRCEQRVKKQARAANYGLTDRQLYALV